MMTLESINLSIFTEKEKQPKLKSKNNDLASPWKILIVDDEIAIHEMTKLALNDFTFKRKNLTFLSAYSVQDAKQMIKTHPDIVLMFLDVMMERDRTGLEVVEYIRKVLDNQLIRIVMRAGHANIMSEDIVSLNYDINDYKVKTALTIDKLSFVVLQGLKSYQQKAITQAKLL
ncbi:response regulator receiver protein [Gloeothece citriformis PCC 7424]|uniref:Response regulator receiver protein n=1 Tax=Gloeothece citriformis (strain PCC 7424) TaxID=65393 RepID=B7KLC3_GLOC7|nr:response regulator [Gloeothece citriformis]ACK72495.1 response regulator receiver protein [Gloeothece citriformis PCC 7424]